MFWSQGLLHIGRVFAEPSADDGRYAVEGHKVLCRETVPLLGVLTAF